jgi:hypothetical protein
MKAWCQSRTACRQAAVGCLVLLGWGGGCAAPSSIGAGTAAAPDVPTGAPGLPTGAIQVGRNLYQVPIGRDVHGCQMYRLYSPTLMVTEAVSYRSRDGGFTIDRRAAVCDRGGSISGAPGAQA